MAIADEKDGKVWGLFKLPFRSTQSTMTSRSSSHNTLHYLSQQHQSLGNASLDDGSVPRSNSSSSVSSVARSLLPVRRRLKLDPSNKLYFPCKTIFSLLPFKIICNLIDWLDVRLKLVFVEVLL